MFSLCRTHSFLLSYARKDSKIDDDPNRPDPHFDAFLQRLNMRVDQLTGARGFVDRTNILAGQDWPDELAEALRTAHTMVCLYSPSYFLSDYCGKEMQILLDRRRQYVRKNGGKKPANIIPVLWHPALGRIPRALPEIQYQAPKLDPKIYGAWNLGDQGKDGDLRDFTDQIALRVRDAADESPLPELDYRPRMNAVRSAFRPPPLPLPEFDSTDAAVGPDAATFVYASSTQWDAWPWAPPVDRAVLYLASAVAKGREMEPTQLAFNATDANLAERLASARRKNNVVILLVDAASLTIEALRARIKDYDCPEHLQFAAVVIWNNNRVPDLESKMNETFDYSKRKSPYFHLVEKREDFSDVISATLDALRNSVINNPHEPNRIRDRTEFPTLPALNTPGHERTA